MDKIILQTSIQRASVKMGGHFIEVPFEQAEAFIARNKKRVMITFPGGHSFHRALQCRKDGYCLISLGLNILKTIKAQAGDEVKITITPDTSKYGMDFPEELQEVLRQDDEGRQRFEELMPGLKRSFLYYISTAKNVDTRIERSLKLIENLKMGILSAGDPR